VGRLERHAYVCGALLLGLGGLVLAGWLAGSVQITQLRPGWAPMQVETALGLALLGLALLAVSGRRERLGWAAGSGGLAVLLAGAALAQHATGGEWAIGPFHVPHEPASRTPSPGRMSLFTAIGQLSLAAALLLLLRVRRPEQLALAVALASLPTAAGAAALLGYAGGVDGSWGWRALRGMAVHAAAGLVAGGAGVLALAARRVAALSWTPSLALVPPVLLAGIVASVWLASAIADQRRHELGIVLDARAEELRRELEADLRALQRAIDRMASRDTDELGDRDQAWVRDATRYVAHFDSLRVMLRLGPAAEPARVVPALGAGARERLVAEVRARPELRVAVGDRVDAAAPGIPLPGGEAGFALAAPIAGAPGEPALGWVVGVFESRAFLARILDLSDTAPLYAVAVRTPSGELYRRSGASDALRQDGLASRSLPGGAGWELEVWPGAELERLSGQELPAWTLLMGLVMTGLAAAGAALAVGAERRRRQVEQANRELHDLRERFELAARSSVDGIWDWDVRTGEERFSERWCELLGYRPSELVPHVSTFQQLIHPEDQARVWTALRAHFDERAPYDLELRLRTRSGGYRWFRTAGEASRDAAGRPIRMAGSISDIQRRKRYERRLQASLRELERSHTEMEQIARITAHELQEPLRDIVSYLQLVTERYRERLDDDGQQFVDFAVDGARRLKARLRDLLAFSRAGGHARTQAPVPLAGVMESARKALAEEIEETEGSLSWPESPPSVLGDTESLSQVFVQLFSNSLKYVEGKPPRIRVDWQPDTLEDRAGDGSAAPAWRITVADEGIGIAPRYLERIFEMFQRLHRPDEYEGTGVGLALCRKIVEGHGGTIWAESAPGEGARFHFTLPATERPEADGEETRT